MTTSTAIKESSVLSWVPKFLTVLLITLIISALSGLFYLKADNSTVDTIKEDVKQNKFDIKEVKECVVQTDKTLVRVETILERVEKVLDKQ